METLVSFLPCKNCYSNIIVQHTVHYVKYKRYEGGNKAKGSTFYEAIGDIKLNRCIQACRTQFPPNWLIALVAEAS